MKPKFMFPIKYDGPSSDFYVHSTSRKDIIMDQPKECKLILNLVFVNSMYLHRGQVYSLADNIRLGIIGCNDAYIFPFNSILD